MSFADPLQLPPQDDIDAFMNAAARGNMDDVAAFIAAYPAFPGFRDSKGQTALMHAAMLGDTSIVRLLLERGARLDDVDFGGRTAMAFAVKEKAHPDTISLLQQWPDIARQRVVTEKLKSLRPAGSPFRKGPKI